MTAQHPSLLPLAVPLQLGLPFHGYVKNGTLHDGTFSMTYPHDDATDWDTSAIAVRGTGAVVPKATDYDLERHYRWQDYAILSGRYRAIAEFNLGEKTWIYSDEQHSWVMYYTATNTASSITIKVYLAALFGVMWTPGTVPKVAAPVLLAEYSWTPVNWVGDAVTYSDSLVIPSHSIDGAVSVFNVATKTLTSAWNSFGGVYNAVPVYDKGSLFGVAYLHDIIKVTVAENGSLEPGVVGSGITATITHEKTAPNLVLGYSSSESAYSLSFAQFHCVQNDRSIVYATRVYETTTASELVQYDEGPPPLYYTQYTNSRTITLGFSGYSLQQVVSWVYKNQAGNLILISGSVDGVALDTGQCGAAFPTVSNVQWVLTNPYSVDMAVALRDAQGYCLSSYTPVFMAVGKEGETEDFTSLYESYGQGCAIAYDSAAGVFAGGSDSDRICFV